MHAKPQCIFTKLNFHSGARESVAGLCEAVAGGMKVWREGPGGQTTEQRLRVQLARPGGSKGLEWPQC